MIGPTETSDPPDRTPRTSRPVVFAAALLGLPRERANPFLGRSIFETGARRFERAVAAVPPDVFLYDAGGLHRKGRKTSPDGDLAAISRFIEHLYTLELDNRIWPAAEAVGDARRDRALTP